MAVINAASANLSDVQAAVNSAHNGDTVVVPSTSTPVSWTGTLTVNTCIVLQGSTTIIGDHTSTMTSNDQTIILDDVPVSGGAGNAVLVSATYNSTGFRPGISGITFRGDLSKNANLGGIVMVGSASDVRVTNCHFDNLYYTSLTVGGTLYGVMDHCISNDSHFEAGFVAHNGGSPYGDQSWNQFPQFGTANFWFIEDCSFTWTGNPGSQNAQGFDSYVGGRYVCRYSKFFNAKPNTHGTETPGRLRSSRAIEIYHNTLNWTPGNSPTGGQLRGGGMLIHDNAYQNYQSGMGLRVYREYGTFTFPAADGTSGWDQNAGSDGVTPVANGSPGFLFFTGTHNGANGATTLTDTTASFPNLVGYVYRNMGPNNIFKWNSFIPVSTPNTATTIPLASVANGNPGSGAAYSWNTGDVYEIRKLLVSLDQPGRGKGDLITGDAPNMVNSTTGTVAWPHQALEPVYAWNNTNTGGPSVAITSYGEPTLVSGRDFVELGTVSGVPSQVTGTYVAGLNGVNYTGDYVYPHPLTAAGSTPIFLSNNSTTFTTGVAGSFTVSVSSFPVAAISRTSGSLPAALSFVDNGNNTGTLSGIVGAGLAGSYPQLFSAVNSGGSSSQNFTITVVSTPTPVINSPLVSSGTVSQPFNYTITATNGPTSFNAMNLAPGLTVNTGTGVISGTPTTQGTYNATISATNASGTGSATLVLTITPGSGGGGGSGGLGIPTAPQDVSVVARRLL